MVERISFVVFGEPNSLKRHRAFRRGDGLVMVDPSKADKHDFLSQALKFKPSKPLSVPFKLVVRAFFKRPKAHYLKGKPRKDAPFFCVKTPDADNLLKFVGDALNSIFWEDDRFIAEATITKCYAEVPRVEVDIVEFGWG